MLRKYSGITNCRCMSQCQCHTWTNGSNCSQCYHSNYCWSRFRLFTAEVTAKTFSLITTESQLLANCWSVTNQPMKTTLTWCLVDKLSCMNQTSLTSPVLNINRCIVNYSLLIVWKLSDTCWWWVMFVCHNCLLTRIESWNFVS